MADRRKTNSFAAAMAAAASAMQAGIEQAAAAGRSPAFEYVRAELDTDMDPAAFADSYAETLACAAFMEHVHGCRPLFRRNKVLEAILPAGPIAEFQAVIDSAAAAAMPFADFYEAFLDQYNPARRQAGGVWYTPRPVAEFIVRAVNDVLISDFGLPAGLADDSTLAGGLPRLQIVDPAAGAGTFLLEAVRQFPAADLAGRLHGFEIMLAPYAVCLMNLARCGLADPSIHLKSFVSGGHPADAMRLADHLDWTAGSSPLFSPKTAKRENPILCVIGNPPYDCNTAAPGGWIVPVLEDYRREPDRAARLAERNPKGVSDLYVQFIRAASHLIERSGRGVMGLVTNHGYLDNLVTRGMRRHLLETFDRIWLLDLHGNANRGETAPDGGPDQNVFDIRTGAAVVVAAKTGSGERFVKMGDCFGTRERKFAALPGTDFRSFKPVAPVAPDFYFKRINVGRAAQYRAGIPLREFLPVKCTGITTSNDAVVTDPDRERLAERIRGLAELPADEARERFNIPPDKDTWSIAAAKRDIGEFDESRITPVAVRPFDHRWIYYTGRGNGLLAAPRYNTFKHLLQPGNFALVVTRQQSLPGFRHAFVLPHLPLNSALSNVSKEGMQAAPFQVHENRLGEPHAAANFEPRLHARLLETAPHASDLAVLDYLYGTLHCRDYRAEYETLLQKGLPVVPWPAGAAQFDRIAAAGGKLRRLHLMQESFPPQELPAGNNTAERVEFADGRAWINKTQYFEVSKAAWDFRIGSYYPARRWLNDRKGRILSEADIAHYSSVAGILAESAAVVRGLNLW